ncbi:MAG: ATP-binding protein [Marinilabiliaceae bacterium]|nr:ATP-binding protein [Marinilabiliaceae bacterium]
MNQSTQSDKQINLSSSKVKRINIALPNGYEFFHSPSSEDKIDERFIGRTKLIKRFKDILLNSKIKKGAYLVTGYRGMGKSSFVSKVLKDVENEKKKQIKRLVELKLNLGHEVLNEFDILSLIAKNLENKFENKTRFRRILWIIILLLLGLVCVASLIFSLFDIITTQEGFIYKIIRNVIGENFLMGDKNVWTWIFFGAIIGLVLLIFFRKRQGILKKIRVLNANIESTLIHERSVGSNIQGISGGYKVKRDFHPYTIRQMEQDLIDIFEKITETFLEFIIVFDELDKIDPSTNGHHRDKEGEMPGFENDSSGFKGGAISRHRKQNILKLLANLKFFITTAKSKFIFITGRELYDAYLADVSDREFAISSIFHEVMYVESFLSDNSDKDRDDITSMVEHYVCRFVIPKKHVKNVESKYSNRLNIYTIKEFKNYFDTIKKKSCNDKYKEILNQYISGFEHRLAHVCVKKKWLGALLQCIIPTYYEKIIKLKGSDKIESKGNDDKYDGNWKNEMEKGELFLYQFVHYLTHVSNGAPKKLTNFFEKYVTQVDMIQYKREKDETIFIHDKKVFNKLKRGKPQYYLSFGFSDQTHIGFMHYMANPLILAIVNNVSHYGDKLLVSASFLLDHIYKFHRNGFSWRNLEHVPEILDINRTPELRSFINSILQFMKQTHLSPIVSGLHMFKFPKKISEEISFISRVNEEASAIFNFTLDESLSVKQHYVKLLDYYTRRNQKELKVDEGKNPFIHSVAGLHHILGDLKLLDEEYTEAIFEYQDSLQSISRKFDKYEPHQEAHLLFIIRTLLKLGLAFEKRKTYDSAYVTYNELISLLIDFRDVDEDQLGLGYKTEPLINWQKQRAVLYHKAHSKQKEDDFYVRETNPRILWPDEYKKIDYCVNGDELIPSLSSVMTPLKNKIINRLSLFEDVRLMYQALLAKLFVLEKTELGGITPANLKVVENEFLYLHLATNLKEKFLISADFYRKLGDILYYKNGLIDQNQCSFFNGLALWGFDIGEYIDAYCKEHHKMHLKRQFMLLKDVELWKEMSRRDLAGCASCEHLENIKEKSGPIKRLNEYYCLSNGFSKEITKSSDENNEKPTEQIIKNKLKGIIQLIFNCYHVKKEINESGNLPLETEDVNDFIDKVFSSNAGGLPRELTIDLLKKEFHCNEKRLSLLEKRAVAPCYACKYYNRSLKILAEHFLGTTEIEHNQSKVFVFLDALENPVQLRSNRNNYMQTVASSLASMGDVLVSCSDKGDKIRSEFLEAFIWNLQGTNKTYDLKKKVGNHLSQIERALLYYYTSAKYYRRSSSFKEVQLMYKKILKLLIAYIRLNPCGTTLLKYKISNDPNTPIDQNALSILEHIKQQIVRRIFQNTFTAYDYIHLPEIQKLKWNGSLEMYEKLNLRNISLFPELEEVIYNFYELKLECEKDDDKTNEMLRTLSTCRSLTTYRLNSSIYARMNALRFKVLMNRKGLEQLLGKEYSFSDTPYEPDHPILFYEALTKLLLKEGKLLFELETQKEGENYNLAVLEHLIIDSIFCLHTLVSTVTPNSHTTLFSQSYMADVYRDLFVWSQLYDFVFMMHAFFEKQTPLRKKFKIIKKIKRHVEKRKQAAGGTSEDCSNIKDVKELFIIIRKLLDNENKALMKLTSKTDGDLLFDSKCLFEKLLFAIDKNNIHTINANYMAEMAIKRYRNAFDVNKEGKAYKDFIEGMYYLNDDLDNDLLEFNLAIERYRINSGSIENEMNKLKKIYKNAMVFKVENYMNNEN